MLVDTGSYRSRVHILNALAQRHMTVDDVTHVFITHCHWDHVMNMELFRNSTIFIPRLEYEFCANVSPFNVATPSYVYNMCKGLKLELLEPKETALFPGVRTVLLHGHSIGQQGILVDTEDGTALFAGDGIWSARSAYRGRPDMVLVNVEEAMEAVKNALAQADIVYPGHDRPFKFQDGKVGEYLFDAEYKFSFAFDPNGTDMELIINTHDNTDRSKYYKL